MSQLTLIRTRLQDATPGRLYPERNVEPLIYTLEPPWRDNRRNESCIPAGIYEMCWNVTGRHKRTWQLRDIHQTVKEVGPDPNYPRYGIEFHDGTTVQHTDGCILTVNSGLEDEGGMMVLRAVLGEGTNHLLRIVWEREGVEE